MHFSIGEFSAVSGLPAQTLRFYQSKGLLRPESVDARTGYRSYAFEQVERAVLVATLRQAGLAVRDVRDVLDDPGRAQAVLDAQEEALARRRRREDRALAAARRLLTARPEVVPDRFAGEVVLSGVVPHAEADVHEGESADEQWYDWELADRCFATTERRLRDVAAKLGLDPAGPAWRTPAAETDRQKADALTTDGPHWLAKLPLRNTLDAARAAGLPADVEVQAWPGRDEIGIHVPGPVTTGTYSLALQRLVEHPLADAFVDLGPGGQRLVVADDAFELRVGLLPISAD